MSPPPGRRPEGSGFGLLGGTAGLPDRVGQGKQVVGAGEQRVGVRSLSQHFPPAWGGEAVRMLRTKVVAVRLGVNGQRPKHGGRVGVDVRERGNR